MWSSNWHMLPPSAQCPRHSFHLYLNVSISKASRSESSNAFREEIAAATGQSSRQRKQVGRPCQRAVLHDPEQKLAPLCLAAGPHQMCCPRWLQMSNFLPSMRWLVVA